MKLTKEELYEINGGGITATMLNAFARAFNTVLEFGRTVGTAIRRISSKNYC